MKGENLLKNRILVDTCVWIEFFNKPGSKIGNELEGLLIEDSVFTCGVILYELLQGIKTKNDKEKILDIFLNLPYIEYDKNVWIVAGEISLSLRKKGFNIPFSDILISAIALKNELKIFTIDHHFENIENINLYKI